MKIGMIFLLSVFLLWMTPATAQVKVTVTTTHLADLVTQVGGDYVIVEALMGPGVDPHLYKPSAPDVGKLNRADVIFYNGLLLEGQLGELFARMVERGRNVRAVAEAVPVAERMDSSDYEGHFDPHVWFDPVLWSYAVDAVVEELSKADPQGANVFATNGAFMKASMLAAGDWATKRISGLSRASRVLITSHDAFNYFGRKFGVEVIAVQGISTATEAGLADISGMVNLIKQRNIKAIFVESSVSPAAIERISRDSGAAIGGELLSDSLGTPGELFESDGSFYDMGTWEGMFRYNVSTFVNAMR